MAQYLSSKELFLKTLLRNGSLSSYQTDNTLYLSATIEEKHGHERYGADGIVFHKDTIILISSMIIMIFVGKSHQQLIEFLYQLTIKHR